MGESGQTSEAHSSRYWFDTTWNGHTVLVWLGVLFVCVGAFATKPLAEVALKAGLPWAAITYCFVVAVFLVGCAGVVIGERRRLRDERLAAITVDGVPE